MLNWKARNMIHRNFIAVAAAVFMTACTQQAGTVYPVKIDEARRVLTNVCLPPLVFGSQPPDCEARTVGASEIAWVARQKGVEIFRYVATLTDEGNGSTRVAVALKGAESGPAGNVAQKLKDNRTIRHMYVVAMEERISSALERRSFEMSRIYPAMAAASAANMSSINSSVDEAHSASQQLARDTIKRAYRDEAAGIRR
jgi:hypothetical protein